MVCSVYGVLCIQHFVIYIHGYYIGLENIQNCFNINMVLKIMEYGVIMNGYYVVVLKCSFYGTEIIKFIR